MSLLKDPFDLKDPHARELLEICSRGDSRKQRIKLLVDQIDIPEAEIDWDGPLKDVWLRILSLTALRGKLRNLIRVLLTDQDYTVFHPRLEALLEAAEAEERDQAHDKNAAVMPQGTGRGLPPRVFLNLIDRHRVFGGRQVELNLLSEFAAGGAGGYMLVTGRSGTGKTALLANWVQRHTSASNAICAHFISRRDGTASQEDTLVGLCAQLASARGIPDVGAASLPDLEARYIRLLTEPLPAGQRIAVVIDALDEATWTPVPSLFPPLANGVIVILSARERADLDWADRLGLPSETQTIMLGGLGEDDVGEILAAVGAPPRLRTSEAIAAISGKSGGDPYYLALLARDVERGVLRVPAQLSQWPTDLRGYFDRWWQEIVAIDPQGIIQLFAYLLAAVGPVPRGDLIDIDPGDALDPVTIDQIVERAQGQVVGEAEGGYQLAHSRFGEYLERHRIGDASRTAAREALLAYCEGRRELPTQFVLREFPGLLSATGRVERLLDLIDDPGWYEAQLNEDPSGSGYLAGVRVGWEAARQRAASDLASGTRSRWIGREVGCALAVATMRSRLSSIPPELLGTLARQGLWSERSLIAAIRDAPRSSRRTAALEAIVADLSPAGLREALALARDLPLEVQGEPPPRITAMASVIEHLIGDERAAAARELFAWRGQVRRVREWLRVVARPPVARSLSGELLHEAVRTAGDAAAVAEVASLITALRDVQGDTAAVAALDVIGDPGCCAEAIAALAGDLGGEGIKAAARVAAALPADGPSGSARARALGTLAPYLDAGERVRAQQAAGAVGDPRWRAWAELRLAVGGPAGDMETSLRAVAELQDSKWRLEAVVPVLPLLEGEPYDDALGIALAALSTAEPSVRVPAVRILAQNLSVGDAERALAALGAEPGEEELVALVSRLPDHRRAAVLTPQIERRTGDPASALPLNRLLPRDAAEPLLRRYLDALLEASEPDPKLVSALATHAPDEMLPVIRAAALRVSDERLSIDTLVQLLERSPVEDRDDLLDAAVERARAAELRNTTFETVPRAQTLVRLLPFAPPERFDDLLAEALASAQVVGDNTLRLRAEIALLPGLTPDAQAELARHVAALDEDDRIATLLAFGGPLEKDAVLRLVDLAEALPPARALRPLLHLRQVTHDPAAEEASADAARRMIGLLPEDTLAWAAGTVPEDLLIDVLNRAAALPPSFEVVRGLCVVAARANSLRQKVLRLVTRLPAEPDPGSEPTLASLRSFGLMNIAQFLDPDAAIKAVAAAREIQDRTSAVHAWVAVTARLQEPDRSDAFNEVAPLMATQPVTLVADLVGSFARRAPELPTVEVAQAFTTVRERARDEKELAQSLYSIAPFLSPADAATALALTRYSKELSLRLAGIGLVGRLHEEQREAAIADLLPVVEAVEVEESRCEMLTVLGAAAPARLRGALLERALDAATALGKEGDMLARRAVADIDVPAGDAITLSVARLRQALAMDALTPSTSTAENGPTLSLTLTGRPTWVPPPGKPVGSTRRMPSGAAGLRVETGSGLTAIVQGDLMTQVIYERREQLPAVSQVGAFESALARLRRGNATAWGPLVQRLLGHLPLQGPGVLASVESALGRRVHRAIVLEYLAPPLPIWLTPTPISGRVSREADRSTRLLRELTQSLGDLHPSVQHETWNDLLAAISANARPFFLIDLLPITPATIQLSDPLGAQSAAAAIRFVGEQWP
jgi:hypothetical protein